MVGDAIPVEVLVVLLGKVMGWELGQMTINKRRLVIQNKGPVCRGIGHDYKEHYIQIWNSTCSNLLPV